jgi:hypothetical protein
VARHILWRWGVNARKLAAVLILGVGFLVVAGVQQIWDLVRTRSQI